MSSCSSSGLVTESPLGCGTDNLLRVRHSEEQNSTSESAGSTSSGSLLLTPSPITLRSRRALNTTPDSSPSPLVKSDRIRSDSPIPIPTQPVIDTHIHHGPPEPSHTPRYRSHVYFRDESCEDLSGADGIVPAGDSFSSCQISSSKPICPTPILYGIVIISILSALLWWKSSVLTHHPSSPHSSMSNRLQLLIGQLSTEFPNQTNRFWAQLRSALERRVWMNPLQPNDDMSDPTVVLFVKRQPSNDKTNQSEAFNSLFQCFIDRFGRLTTSEVLGQKQRECVVPVEPFMLRTGMENHLSAAQSARYKLDIDSKLKHAYRDGIRCFHFPSIDTLPPDVILLFHGVADAQNSIYRNALLLFSLGHTFHSNNQSVPIDSALVAEHRLLERQIQRHLRALWASTLGSEETDALLSRLTPTVAVFHPTESSIPAMCR